MEALQSYQGSRHFSLPALLFLASGFHLYQGQNMAILALAVAFIFWSVRMKRSRSEHSLHF